MNLSIRHRASTGRFPIARKLVLVAMTSTLIGLLVASTASVAYDRYRIKNWMAQDLSALVMLIAERSNAALLFDDPHLANENLAALRIIPSVISACIYTEDGKVFASYSASGNPPDTTTPPERGQSIRYEAHGLVLSEPVISEGKRVGTVSVLVSLVQLEQAWRSHLAFTALVVLGAGLVAFVLSYRLQRIVSGPIEHLTQTAQLIAQQKDYSVRAIAETNDETGVLVRSFNLMLQTIEQQNGALVESNRDLERRVKERTIELEEARDRAESADRLKSAFLATMSHELRTPLNSIIGFTGVLLQELPGPLNEEQRRQMHMVSNGADHLLALINDVLDLAKIEAGQMQLLIEPFDLQASLESVVDATKPLATKKGLALEARFGSPVPTFSSDRRRVEQILLNLLSNAIKFTERGSVRVEVTCNDARVVIGVTDTGVGIRQQDLAALFKPFTQLDAGIARRHEGTGLGLSICRRLVELLGGIIWARSEWGNGSTFGFELPLRGGVA